MLKVEFSSVDHVGADIRYTVHHTARKESTRSSTEVNMNIQQVERIFVLTP